jgi:hypothetical protein
MRDYVPKVEGQRRNKTLLKWDIRSQIREIRAKFVII